MIFSRAADGVLAGLKSIILTTKKVRPSNATANAIDLRRVDAVIERSFGCGHCERCCASGRAIKNGATSATTSI